MAKIIYKEGCEGQNTLESIEGIEINLFNKQKALIYPKYAELPIFDGKQADEWRAKNMTEYAALKLKNSKEATDELLLLDSPSAKFVHQFKSDKHGNFNLPTLIAAFEINGQLQDINSLAKTIKGAEILKEDEDMCVLSCSRTDDYYIWTATPYSDAFDVCCGFPCMVIPTIIYE